MPPCCAEQLKDVSQLIQRLITYGLSAVVLGEEVAFYKSSDISFESFLYHMTTIFTDVRFNLKGTTLELRTPDSMPVEDFRYRWKQFIEKTSDIC
jgi:glutamate--cysteine ligase